MRRRCRYLQGRSHISFDHVWSTYTQAYRSASQTSEVDCPSSRKTRFVPPPLKQTFRSKILVYSYSFLVLWGLIWTHLIYMTITNSGMPSNGRIWSTIRSERQCSVLVLIRMDRVVVHIRQSISSHWTPLSKMRVETCRLVNVPWYHWRALWSKTRRF